VFKQFTLPGVTNNFAISEIQKYVLEKYGGPKEIKFRQTIAAGRLQAMMKKLQRTAYMEMQM
jgi:hypothetical protein